MNDAMFTDLLQSVRDAGAVLRGKHVAGVKITEAQEIIHARELATSDDIENVRADMATLKFDLIK